MSAADRPLPPKRRLPDSRSRPNAWPTAKARPISSRTRLNEVAVSALGFSSAIGAGEKVIESFVEAFKFKAELDASRTSITALLTGVRDSNQVFNDAAAFGQKFKLTQAEITTAIQATIPVMRQSKASTEEILTTLARLQVLKPEEGIKGAAFALSELAGGQIRSLETRFNVPAEKANEMKKQIEGGADAIKVLSDYLTSAGVGMDALEAQTKGAAGAMKDLAKAQEDLKLAQAEFAQARHGDSRISDQRHTGRDTGAVG